MTADDFSGQLRTAARGTRHRRPVKHWIPAARGRIRAILARTAAARLEIDEVIAGASAMTYIDTLPVIVAIGPAPAPPPKPAPKIMLPRKRMGPDGFVLRREATPVDKHPDAEEGRNPGAGAQERPSDPPARETAARDDAAAGQSA